MSKKKTIGVIGHVDHGKTVLSASIAQVISNSEVKARTIDEMLEEDQAMKISNPYSDLPDLIQESKPNNRRERRKQARAKKR